MRNKILAVAIAAAGVAFSGAAVAATQGNVGATSTGTVVINATIPKLIRITDLADITMTLPAPGANGYAAPATGSSPVCVRQNGAAATYNVTATSANGSFVLMSGALSVAYGLTLDGTALAYNDPVTNSGLSPHKTNLGACAAADLGTLDVSITAADLNAAEGSATDYTDTVTLTVAPD